MLHYKCALACGSIYFLFEDIPVAALCSRAFNLVTDEDPRHRPSVVISGSGPYAIRHDGAVVSCDDAPGLVQALDRVIELAIREAHYGPSRVSVHASTASIGGGVMCMGISGCGKTTLALELALRGEGLLGDEYALVDLDHATVWHECLPVHIKADRLRECYAHTAPIMTLAGNEGVEASAICVPEMLGVTTTPGTAPLRCIVFPQREEGAAGVRMRSPSVQELLHLALPSIANQCSRRETLTKLIGMVARNHIRLAHIIYSDAASAADAIIEVLES